jgi:uncharacterized membrane protein
MERPEALVVLTPVVVEVVELVEPLVLEALEGLELWLFHTQVRNVAQAVQLLLLMATLFIPSSHLAHI